MVSSIWAIEVDAIISSSVRMTIEVLLELIWKGMIGYRDLGLNIAVLKYVSKDLIPIFRKFRLEVGGISRRKIKSGCSVKDEDFFYSRIV